MSKGERGNVALALLFAALLAAAGMALHTSLKTCSRSGHGSKKGCIPRPDKQELYQKSPCNPVKPQGNFCVIHCFFLIVPSVWD